MIGSESTLQREQRACEVHMNSYLQQQHERQAQATVLPAPTSFLQVTLHQYFIGTFRRSRFKLILLLHDIESKV